jgi:cold shock CspA family protein
MLGTVNYFDPRRGFGWIESADIAERIFLHACDLGPEFGPRGERMASVGSHVQFELEEQADRGGFRARLVKAA